MRSTIVAALEFWPDALGGWPKRRASELLGLTCIGLVGAASLALMSWSIDDPSLNHATSLAPHNWLGKGGAMFADLAMQSLGLASLSLIVVPALWGWRLLRKRPIGRPIFRFLACILGIAALATAISFAPPPGSWPLLSGLGGVVGDAGDMLPRLFFGGRTMVLAITGLVSLGIAILALSAASGYGFTAIEEEFVAKPELKKGARAVDDDEDESGREGEPGFALIALGALIHTAYAAKTALRRRLTRAKTATAKKPPPAWEARESAWREPDLDTPAAAGAPAVSPAPAPLLRAAPAVAPATGALGPAQAPASRIAVAPQPVSLKAANQTKAPAKAPRAAGYQIPPITLLAEPKKTARRRSPMTRWSRTRGCSKACSTISASRARSSTCAPARWSRSTSWSPRRASNPRA